VRIGIFTECYKPMLNGVVNSIDGFRIGLTELGHEVFIFCPNYNEKVNEKNIYYCKSFPLPGKSGYHYVFPFDSRKESVARTMDIIHTEHPFIMARRALHVAKKYNKPLVFTNHTQYEQYAHYIPIGKSIIKYIIKKWVTDFVNRCDLVIAPAKGIENKLNEHKIKTAMEIVPNGIDLNRFVNQNNDYLKKEYNLKNWPVFIFVGRIANEKNLEFLIRAFHAVNQKNPESYLFLVGGGPNEKEYNQLIKNLNLGDKVVITGYVPYGEISNYLASANIFITSSKTEVHPLTILEAMATGLPTIAFDTFGTGEIINNNVTGVKTKVDDMDSFTLGMEKLLLDKNLRNNLGENAKNYSRKFSLLETSKQMLKAYSHAIEIHKLTNYE
jgi:glycosyltransferase involved in cell wall biosynthesis